jgi:RimJ/RimL family protein N-acetyltransferase
MQGYADRGFGLWALVLKENGEVIGDCGLVVQQIEGVGEVEIGYHVRRDLWGQGFATEAAQACREYGFHQLGRDRLISLIHPANRASRRVAEKNGMTLTKEFMALLIEGMIFFEKGRIHAPSRKKSYLDSATPNLYGATN